MSASSSAAWVCFATASRCQGHDQAVEDGDHEPERREFAYMKPSVDSSAHGIPVGFIEGQRLGEFVRNDVVVRPEHGAPEELRCGDALGPYHGRRVLGGIVVDEAIESGARQLEDAVAQFGEIGLGQLRDAALDLVWCSEAERGEDLLPHDSELRRRHGRLRGCCRELRRGSVDRFGAGTRTIPWQVQRCADRSALERFNVDGRVRGESQLSRSRW